MKRMLFLAVLVVAIAVPVASGARTAEKELYADLSGSAETPPGPPNGRGNAELTLNPSNGRVCWEFKGLAGLQGTPVAAHIHKGKAGQAGDVVVPFTDRFKRQGCTTATKKIVKAILKTPGNYYVNVHTMKYPAGVVRGQLETSDD